MKSVRIISVLVIAFHLIAMFIDEIVTGIHYLIGLGPIMLTNILIYLAFLTASQLIYWTFCVPDAPIILKYLTSVGRACLVFLFSLVVIQEVLYITVDGFKRSHWGIGIANVVFLIIALFYIWKSINKK